MNAQPGDIKLDIFPYPHPQPSTTTLSKLPPKHLFNLVTLTMSSLKRKATSTEASDPKKPKATINSSITSFFAAPKSSSLGGGTPTVKFDKKKWVEKLTPEQRDLLKLEIETLHESWLAHLKDEVVSSDFLELKRFLRKEKTGGNKIFPPEQDIYSW
jgi:uracil-DNA glycosylase